MNGPREGHCASASRSKVCLESWTSQLPSPTPGSLLSWKNLKGCRAVREQKNGKHPLVSQSPLFCVFEASSEVKSPLNVNVDLS